MAGVSRREFGSGVHANVDAMARIGYLYLRDGNWRGQQLLPPEFVKTASQPVPAVVPVPEWPTDNHGNASQHYGLLWWNNADGELKDVPRVLVLGTIRQPDICCTEFGHRRGTCGARLEARMGGTLRRVGTLFWTDLP